MKEMKLANSGFHWRWYRYFYRERRFHATNTHIRRVNSKISRACNDCVHDVTVRLGQFAGPASSLLNQPRPVQMTSLDSSRRPFSIRAAVLLIGARDFIRSITHDALIFGKIREEDSMRGNELTYSQIFTRRPPTFPRNDFSVLFWRAC